MIAAATRAAAMRRGDGADERVGGETGTIALVPFRRPDEHHHQRWCLGATHRNESARTPTHLPMAHHDQDPQISGVDDERVTMDNELFSAALAEVLRKHGEGIISLAQYDQGHGPLVPQVEEMRARKLLGALRAAASALTTDEVDHVVIGDLAIAHHLGESCTARVLELLVGPEDLRCAQKALLGAGFDRGEGENLLEDADGVRVELHAGLVDPEAGARLTATKADVQGVTVAVARPEYLIWSCLQSEEPHDLEGAERLVERRVLPFDQLATWIRSRASKRELARFGAIVARVRGRIEQRRR